MGLDHSLVIASALVIAACGHRATSPQTSSPRLTSARPDAGAQYERLLVAEEGVITMVARDGCVASVSQDGGERLSAQELVVRCPKQERLSAWFRGVDRITGAVALVRVSDDDAEEIPADLPAAELVNAHGDVVAVKEKGDAKRVAAEVRALVAELASTEVPSPGPQSAGGWQLLHVSGPAHVLLRGSPAHGVLDIRVSTSGQYLCEFVATMKAGPIRAKKSGFLAPRTASQALDEVLGPFAEGGAAQPSESTVSAVKDGTERRASAPAAAAVFPALARVQDALGDACLPELDPPAPLSL